MRKRPWSSPSEGTPCCRSTIASTPCSRPFRNLTRSSLHRCLKRHGISRLPQVEGEASPKRKFKTYPIGFFHVDIAQVQTAQGKLYLFVAIDRASKFAVTQLVDKANRQTARAFLEALVAAVPYRVEIVLTDNGVQFADLPKM